jgi:addiction module HigA family antidote
MRRRRDQPIILRRLDALDVAAKPADMNVSGFNFHSLQGFDPTRYSVHVNGRGASLSLSRMGRQSTSILSNIPDARADPVRLYEERAMKTYKAARAAERAPTHPGEILREDVPPALDMPVKTAAEHLGVTRQTLHRILAGTTPVTPSMALRLGKFCGNGPALWLSMQGAYDLWIANRELHDEIAKIKTFKAAGRRRKNVEKGLPALASTLAITPPPAAAPTRSSENSAGTC